MHTVDWLKKVMTTKDNGGIQIPDGDSLKQDLMFCNAAGALGLDRQYYNHIHKPWFKKVQKLTADDFTQQRCLENIVLIEEPALSLQDPLLRRVANSMVQMQGNGKTKLQPALREFLK